MGGAVSLSVLVVVLLWYLVGRLKAIRIGIVEMSFGDGQHD
jgi:hypothetical protein